jgi:hypothetical protein
MDKAGRGADGKGRIDRCLGPITPPLASVGDPASPGAQP